MHACIVLYNNLSSRGHGCVYVYVLRCVYIVMWINDHVPVFMHAHAPVFMYIRMYALVYRGKSARAYVCVYIGMNLVLRSNDYELHCIDISIEEDS